MSSADPTIFHGGIIEVESPSVEFGTGPSTELGTGSTFTVRLPVKIE